MEKNLVYLKHIWDAVLNIEKFTKGFDYKKFSTNKLVQNGVIRELEIIGEATKRLSADFKRSYKDVPWKDIAGMRDKLIHDYFGTDIRVVWQTVKQDLPELKKEIKDLLLLNI